MREGKYPIAVLVSDIHLCIRPPVFRSIEKDWLGRQADYLNQLAILAQQVTQSGEDIPKEDHLPIFCGGDVFDKWNSSAELINFALKDLPNMYAIPGQHDLPNHSYEDIRKSAYWTLVEAGVITNLLPRSFTDIPTREGLVIRAHSFPWDFPVEEPKVSNSFVIDLCLIHSLIWTKDTGYNGAPPDQRLKPYKRKLRGFDTVLFGDNHKSVFWNLDKEAEAPAIFNPGSFMIRTTDQVEHKPCVGLLYNDGSVVPQYLDISKDKYLSQEMMDYTKVGDTTLGKLIGQLYKLRDSSINFEAEVNKKLDQVEASPSVRRIVLSCMEEWK